MEKCVHKSQLLLNLYSIFPPLGREATCKSILDMCYHCEKMGWGGHRELGAGIILLRVMFTGAALLSPVLLLDNLALIDTLILY